MKFRPLHDRVVAPWITKDGVTVAGMGAGPLGPSLSEWTRSFSVAKAPVVSRS